MSPDKVREQPRHKGYGEIEGGVLLHDRQRHDIRGLPRDGQIEAKDAPSAAQDTAAPVPRSTAPMITGT